MAQSTAAKFAARVRRIHNPINWNNLMDEISDAAIKDMDVDGIRGFCPDRGTLSAFDDFSVLVVSHDRENFALVPTGRHSITALHMLGFDSAEVQRRHNSKVRRYEWQCPNYGFCQGGLITGTSEKRWMEAIASHMIEQHPGSVVSRGETIPREQAKQAST